MSKYAEYYEKLVQFAIDHGFTSVQACGATKKQFAQILGIKEDDTRWSGTNIGLFLNVRENVALELERREKQAIRDLVLAQFDGGERTVIRSAFPSFELEYKEMDSKRAVVLWLDGKP